MRDATGKSSSGCPPREVLEQSAAMGELDEELSSHVSSCDSCSETLEAVRRDNMLLAEFVHANMDRLAPEARLQIEGYEIERQIESGGQGIVFKAVHRHSRRPVALKMLLHGSFATRRARRRFEREIELAAALRHPNIVTVYDSGRTAAGAHWLAMEFVDGVALDQYLARASLARPSDDSIMMALRLFESICDAVAAAHLRGIIHRDLKPANVLVDRDGQPRVLDFGLARQLIPDEDGGPTRTVEGEFRGTFAYAAPEQFSGRPDDVDVRSDVYALGAMLYEMLTGHRPHHEKQSLAELIEAVREREPALPRTLNPKISDDLQTLTLKAMAKEPARRYQTADALLADVRHYLAGEPIDARRDSRLYVIRKSLARHPAATAAAMLALVALIGFSAVMTMLYNRAIEHERRAEQARGLEREQRLIAERGRRDLEQVVAFQQAQLAEINTQSMGVWLRNDLLARVPEVLARRGVTPEDIERALGDFERIIEGVNFTDAALGVLHEHIFARAMEAIDGQFADQPLVQARLLHTVAEAMGRLGLLESAEQPQRRALEIHRDMLGKEHPLTLTSLNSMGVLLVRQGRLDEAEGYYRQAVDARRRVLGEFHPDALLSVSNLAALLERQGRVGEAEPLYREALEMSRRSSGDEVTEFRSDEGSCSLRHFSPDGSSGSSRTLTLANNLGILLYQQGRLDEAEVYWREVLEGRRRVLGEEHPETLTSINNMGALHRARDELDEAERYYREALAIRLRVLGSEHPATLQSMNNLGFVLRQRGGLEEAEPYYRDALERSRRILGDEHPETLVFMNNTGRLLRDLGRLEEAELLGYEAVETARRVLPRGHWHIGMFLAQYAQTLVALERFDEAERAMLEAHAMAMDALGPEHRHTIGIAGQVADFYDAWHAHDAGAGHDESAILWRETEAHVDTEDGPPTADRR